MIIYLEHFKYIQNEIEKILLYTNKGNILLDYLFKYIDNIYFYYNDLDFFLKKEKIEDEPFYKVLLTYKELKHMELNLEGF